MRRRPEGGHRPTGRIQGLPDRERAGRHSREAAPAAVGCAGCWATRVSGKVKEHVGFFYGLGVGFVHHCLK